MGFIFTRMLYFCVYHVIRRILYILFANHFVIVVGCGRVFQVTCLIEIFFKWSVASEILVWTSRIGFMEVGCLHALRSSSVLLTIIIYGFPDELTTGWHWQEFPYPEYWTVPTKADNVFIFAYNMTNIIVTTFWNHGLHFNFSLRNPKKTLVTMFIRLPDLHLTISPLKLFFIILSTDHP